MSGILSIEMIKASGALTSHKPIKKEIEWTVGIETFKADVYVRQLSYDSYVNVVRNGFDAGDRLALATRLASSICDENGNQIFTVTDIVGGKSFADGEQVEHGGMCESLIKALWGAMIAASIPEKKPVASKKSATKKKRG